MPAPRGPRPGLNSQTHVAQVATALLSLADGSAKTKKDAAAKAGTSKGALTPAKLAALAAASPVFRRLFKTNALDVSVEITGEDGKQRRVSAREALSRGAERCVAKLAALSEKVGDWKPEERETFTQVEKWLRVSTTLGLFRDDSGPALPGELANGDQDDEGSLEWYLRPCNTHRIPPGLLTVQVDGDEIPAGDQAITDAGKVEE